MGKPEIIGWEPDPNATDEERYHASLYGYGVDGNSYYLYRHAVGWVPPQRLYKHASTWPMWMRWLGMKPVYREREFRFVPDASGYEVTCKTCDETSWTGILPHDYARWHSRRYHGPKYAVSVARSPMGSTLGLEPGKLAPQLVTQLEPEPDVDNDDLPCTHEETWMGKCAACPHEVGEW